MSLTDKKVVDLKNGLELADLRKEQLHKVSLKEAELHGVDARDTSLLHVNFVNSKWNHIYFSNVHVNEIQMGGTLIENIRRPQAAASQLEDEPGTDGWVNVEPVRFRHCDLSQAVFEHCDLTDVDLNHCQVENMRINGIPVGELLNVYEERRREPSVITRFRRLREETLALIEGIPPEWYDRVPDGFNNSIRWNLGHILVAWDHAIFPKLDEAWRVPNHYHYLFPKGSSPQTWKDAPPDFMEIVDLVRDQTEQIIEATLDKLDEPLAKPFLDIRSIREMYGFMLHEEAHHLNCMSRIRDAIGAETSGEAGGASGTAHEQGDPCVVTVPGFAVVGASFDANLQEIDEKQLGKKAYEFMLANKHRIPQRVNDHLHLVQLYPMKPGFNAQVDAFTQIIGYLVPEEASPPEGMVLRKFAERQYVKATHRGLESELGRTYDRLYGSWMMENGHNPAGYDFEVWDGRYKPDQADNEIDVFVALAD